MIDKVGEFDWSRHLNIDQIWESGSAEFCFSSLFRFEDPEYL